MNRRLMTSFCVLVLVLPALPLSAEGPATRPAEAPSSRPTSQPSKSRKISEQGAGEGAADLIIVEEPPSAPAASRPVRPKRSRPVASRDKSSAVSTRADLALRTISILGGEPERLRIAGAANQVDKQTLQRLQADDIHRVLSRVPGVYVRGEDGFGLRPNIGLRGANSDRSAKVTLMEDGVLLAPAPYSAPAAYFFPLTTRLVGVEVFKGPAAIRYGPNTIGGAINLKTRAIPVAPVAVIDSAYGLNRRLKVHSYAGMSGRRWGVLLEGAHIETQGFKELDGGGDTGFAKNELMLKARVHNDPGSRVYQQLTLKLGYADELSRETYLGLSDADFERNSLRRYAASQRGLMDWSRAQVQLSYYAGNEDFDLTLNAYRHDFSRVWTKLNRFRDGPSLSDILRNPASGQTAVYYGVLSGRDDSAGSTQALLLGRNDRRYVAQGISLEGRWSVPTWWGVNQELSGGLRLHHDEIERDHSEAGFLMRSATLVPEGSDRQQVLLNQGRSYVVAFYLQDQIAWGRLTLTPGLRVEIIDSKLSNFQNGARTSNDYAVALPGVGVHYAVLDGLGVFAGVHRGFSPVSPGQPEGVDPEDSINYESGLRLVRGGSRGELVGFFNDYSNLTSECTLSTGCADALLNRQFNAGSVHISGLELALGQTLRWRKITLHADANYTLTLSDFRTSFLSDNPQFADVEKGDRLPYVPIHQLALLFGAEYHGLTLDVTATYVGQMRDVAGQGDVPDAERVPGRFVVDLASSYAISDSLRAYLRIDNLFDNRYIVSRRPFGARPGLPFQFLLGLRLVGGSA